MNQLTLRSYRSFFFVAIAICLLCQNKGIAQGCSDAGFCTLHPLKPTNQIDSTSQHAKNQLIVGLGRGQGDFSIMVTTPYVEYSRFFRDRFQLNVKLGYLFASGELKNNGLSDIYVNGSYSITNATKGILGIKIPLNDGNMKEEGRPLPMNYQASLGTFDVIVGLSTYPIKNLGLTIAYQQPLTQNKNQYPSTNQFHRQGDVLFRLNYQISIVKNKLTVTPGLLPIYHISKDTYVNDTGQRRPIDGSEGLTFNGNIFIVYHFNNRQSVELSGGKPFITRKVQPDGLARKYVFGLEYKFSF